MIPDIDELRALVREVAKEELLPRFARAERQFKGDGSIVTSADLAVQQRITSVLDRLTPGIPVLAEEMSAPQQESMLGVGESGLWCLDPVDGTSNFAAGIPFFSISLALIAKGMPVFGLVYDPLRDECFWARRGEGAWLDRERLYPGAVDLPLHRCIAMIDTKRLGPRAGRFIASPPYGSQRSFGSVALEWCWLAAGRCQVYVHGRQALWDYAAGLLILQEAGGKAMTLEGESVFLPRLVPRTVFAASTPALFDAARSWLDGLGAG
jgi:myo-inositol-1(or 4)-monophosphatase